MHSHFFLFTIKNELDQCLVTVCFLSSSELIKICWLSDLMPCIWYSQFHQSDRQQGNRKINIFTWIHGALLWKSGSAHQMLSVVGKVFVKYICWLCYCRHVVRADTGIQGYFYFTKYERACYILNVVICLLIPWCLSENQTETILIIWTLLAALFHVFLVGHGTFCRPNSFHRCISNFFFIPAFWDWLCKMFELINSFICSDHCPRQQEQEMQQPYWGCIHWLWDWH